MATTGKGKNMTEKPNWTIMPFIDCWDYTWKAALDVLEQDPRPSLLLIDNGSTRETRLKAEEFCKDGITPGVNLLLWRHAPPLPSLAATWNRALDFVWEAGGEHALVVNNDVRLHQHTYSMLHWAQAKTGALFITGVGVREEEFDSHEDYNKLPMGSGDWNSDELVFSKGGPDFSCFLISRACHERYRFDENFVPCYHEDNDYHRRMILGGDGDKIFSINVPFLHFGSVTINRDEKTKAEWGAKFEKCQAYYLKKWGGMPGHELFEVPFGAAPAEDQVDGSA